jgi:hypothetical protein
MVPHRLDAATPAQASRRQEAAQQFHPERPLAVLPENPMTVEPKVGDVVKLTGPHETWRDCLMTVEEVRQWGVIGVVAVPGQSEAPLRVSFSEIAAVYREVQEKT